MELTGINVELVDQPRPLPASHDLHLGLLRVQSITRPEQTPWATQKSQVIWSYHIKLLNNHSLASDVVTLPSQGGMKQGRCPLRE